MRYESNESKCTCTKERHGGYEAIIQQTGMIAMTRGNNERVKVSTNARRWIPLEGKTILERLSDGRVRQLRNSRAEISFPSFSRRNRKPSFPSACTRTRWGNSGGEASRSFRPLVFGAIAARNSCCPMVNRTLFEHRGNRSEQVFPMYRHSHPTAIFNCGFFEADISPP